MVARMRDWIQIGLNAVIIIWALVAALLIGQAIW